MKQKRTSKKTWVTIALYKIIINEMLVGVIIKEFF